MHLERHCQAPPLATQPDDNDRADWHSQFLLLRSCSITRGRWLPRVMPARMIQEYIARVDGQHDTPRQPRPVDEARLVEGLAAKRVKRRALLKARPGPHLRHDVAPP